MSPNTTTIHAAPTSRCRAPRWDRPGLPRKGWWAVDVEDLEDACFECELCGYPEVRFVHVMAHLEHPDLLRVGCVCAGHLEQDYSAAKDRDRRARNAAQRRANVAKRHARARERWTRAGTWCTSTKGNFWRTVGTIRVVVFPNVWKLGEWKASIGDRFGTRSYPTPQAAMLGIFDRLYPVGRLLADLKANNHVTIKLPGERGFR